METIIKQICERNTHRYFKTAKEIADILRNFIECKERISDAIFINGKLSYLCEINDEGEMKEFTFDELFNYWYKNIKDK